MSSCINDQSNKNWWLFEMGPEQRKWLMCCGIEGSGCGKRRERCCITAVAYVYGTNGLVSVCCITDRMQHTTEWNQAHFLTWERCCITVACGTKGLASLCYITNRMQHTTEPGPLSEIWDLRGERCGLRNEWVSERVFVASVKQHTIEPGPLSRGERCCIWVTVAYRANG